VYDILESRELGNDQPPSIKESLFGVNFRRCELVLATILKQPWHSSECNLTILLDIRARTFIFDVTWEGISNR
jgi:hypothetical protein